MRALVILLLLGGCFLLRNTEFRHAAAPEPTPAAIQEHARAGGPREVVRTLTWGDGEDWTFVLDQIADGRERWLESVPLLLPGADEDGAEDLIQALARALPENPAAVLELDGRISLRHVCSLPFAEAEPEYLHDYALRALNALETVESPRLQQSRRICALRLREAMERVR